MADCTPTASDFLALAGRGNLVPVYREILADTETPVSAYLKIARGPHGFLLESVEGGEKWARYSFLGSEPAAVFTSQGSTVTLVEDGASPARTWTAEDPLAALKSVLDAYRPVVLPELPRFFGGAVGYVAYDGVRFFERLPATLPDDLGVPEFYFMIPASVLVFDNVSQSIKIVVNVDLRDPGTDPKAAYERAVARIDELVARLDAPLRHAERPPAPEGGPPIQSNLSADEYGGMVARVKEYIRAGDAIQVVVAQRFETPLRAAPFDIYRALRSLNPSPYMFYLQLGDQILVGASPEVMVRVEDGEITVRPIAGTLPRGTTEIEDREFERALLADPKEVAEHVMLLDLGRNDVGRVARIGSVAVTERLVIERYSHVMHIVSNVRGTLADGCDCFDAFRATFPAGTLSGAPKIRAMEILEELEPVRRGVYGGAVGYFGLAGTMDTCIAIRTMLIKDGTVYLQAGAGIVADSDPEREQAECVNKARAMVQALKRAEQLGEERRPCSS